MKKLILASNSPRRKELLEKAGYVFEVIPSEYDEKSFSSDPFLTAETFAVGKAKDVYSRLADKSGSVVLGSDTIIYSDGKILGKPSDRSGAEKMLRSLSGKIHSVITGYAIVSDGGTDSGYFVTEVTFNYLSDGVLKSYLDSGLWKGKSGSYGIQDGFPLVKFYVGSVNNVMGLPVELINDKIDKALEK